MKRLFKERYTALFMALLCVSMSPLSHAALTDLASQPLANVSGNAAVKPNVMFLLDSSGSMGWDFNPDWVRYAPYPAATRNCFDSKDDNDVITTTPANATPSTAGLKGCVVGDPPYMSSGFNAQYYNPAIRYDPAVNYDGTPMPTQNAANTSNWTLVSTDKYGLQKQDQLGNNVDYVNLVTGYPDRAWCMNKADAASGPNCVKNNAYSYPDNTYGYGTTTGGSVKYIFGAPYYYTIGASEYCTTSDLTTCNVQAAAGGVYQFPATLRWCTNSSFSNCQGKRTTTGYTYPKIVGTVVSSPAAPAVSASGTITVGATADTSPVDIASIVINGANILNPANPPIVATTGTDTSTKRTNTATAIKNAINAYTATSGYSATSSSATVTVTAVTPGMAPNGYTITVTSSAVPVTAATGTLTVSSVANPSSITALTVNGTSIIGATVNCNYSNNSTNRTNCATNIRDAINAYTGISGYSATRSSNVVTITAPLSLGSSANGWTIIETGTVGTAATAFTGGAFAGVMPTTTTPLSGGADAIPAVSPTRVGVAAFGRVNILPGNTYPKYTARTDCLGGASCTYEEEMTNFANWYTYYRTRMQMMKSSAGHAFLTLSSDYRVGFTTIYNTSFSADNSSFVHIGDFDLTKKQQWFAKLYATNPSGGTPLRTALDRIGKLYAGQLGLSGEYDPVQYSCQQNFTILTTDGYWNDSFSSATIGNQDNTGEYSDVRTGHFCARANGCYDGNVPNASNTLADVALYYYWNDLRTGAGWENNVPFSDKDPNPAQHMTTFTLGLGVDGLMTFREDYESATSGDFRRIVTNATGCSWSGSGPCNWPLPVGDTETAIDDLWHAAVNGHGTYFSAKDPSALSAGLASALTNLRIRNAAASASATSTPNVTQDDNDIFSATFRTVKWDGEIVAQKIDTATGIILPTNTWQAQALLDARVGDVTDTRTIYTLDNAAGSLQLKNFSWADLTASERAYFENKCIGAQRLSQCNTLDAAQQILANDSQKMVNFLRGQQEMEDAGIYRNREHVLGDIASAKPAYVRNPRRNYGDPGYSVFKADNAARQATVYVAANDGMLHALNGATGQETWAYMPRIILPALYKLADSNYANNHQFYVDGSPESGDVYINGQWRTILVAGLNKGGRGYYALDITNPASPIALWEICSDSSLCAIADSDIGYTFGNPVITKRPSDGKWVVLVTSGYNNVNPGDGKGYLYVLDAATGTILNKIGTGTGDTTTPSGLGKITARAENASTDNTASTVFGGDLLGNLWRFDMATNSVIKLANLTDYTGVAQPITSRPDVGKCVDTPMVFVGTGKYLGLGDLTDTQRQTIYGIKDSTTTLGTIRNNNMVQQSFTPVSGGYTLTNSTVDLAAKNGWFADLDQNSGERVNLDPALVLGTLVVATNQPTNVSACSTGGNSYQYQLNYCTGSFLQSASGQIAGRQLGTSIAVGFIVIRLPSGALKMITTFAGAEKATGEVGSNVQGSARRVSWREYTQ